MDYTPPDLPCQRIRRRVRAFPKSPLLPVIPPFSVILSGAKNPILSAETLRYAQGDNLPDFAHALGFQRWPLLRQPRLCYNLCTPLNDVGNPRACCLAGRG